MPGLVWKIEMATLQKSAAFFLLLVAFLAPLPFASNRDWAWSPLAVLIAFSLMFLAMARLREQASNVLLTGEMIVALACMGTVLMWSFVQTLPLNVFTDSNTLLASAAAALGKPSPMHVSNNPEGSLERLMRLLSYCGVFWLAAQLGRDAGFARRLTWTVVISGIVSTLYGLAMQIDNGSCVVINVVKAPIGSSCSFSGTFRNSGNYCTFAGLTALICIADIQGRLLRVDSTTTNFAQRLRARLRIVNGTGGVSGAAAIILVGGMFLAGSKGGAAAFLISCVTMVTILNVAARRRSLSTLAAIAILLLFLFAMIGIGGEMLMIRLMQFLNYGDSDRQALVLLSLDAIGLRPFTGWGLGSFQGVYSVLQPANIIPFYDTAHNTYLEAAIELGIPAACIFFIAIAALVARCASGVFQRDRNAHFPAMSIGATVLVAFNSLFDFGIQIPAVAIAYSAILGIGWAQSRSSRI